jgi:hypothetical protein
MIDTVAVETAVVVLAAEDPHASLRSSLETLFHFQPEESSEASAVSGGRALTSSCLKLSFTGLPQSFCHFRFSFCMVCRFSLQNSNLPRNMEENATPHEDQDEYVLLDLDGVYGLIDIPPNANYVLTVSSLINFFIFFIDLFLLF